MGKGGGKCPLRKLPFLVGWAKCLSNKLLFFLEFNINFANFPLMLGMDLIKTFNDSTNGFFSDIVTNMTNNA